MDEYITRNNAISAVCFGCNQQFSDEPCEPSECSIRQSIMALPTADVVEVVRCKDCKHCDVIYPLKCAGAEAITVYFCGFNNVPRKADDFCSYGERKE